MNLNVITAVSRPFNLKAIGLSIENAISNFKKTNPEKNINLTWYTIFDGRKKFPDLKQLLIEWNQIKSSFSFFVYVDILTNIIGENLGGAQRTHVHSLVKNSWNCAIDDDNIMHKNYITNIDNLIFSHPQAKAFLLERHNYPQQSPKKIICGRVDTGEILYFIEDGTKEPLIWPPNYRGDYEFIDSLHKKLRENFYFIKFKNVATRPLFYNFLGKRIKYKSYEEPCALLDKQLYQN